MPRYTDEFDLLREREVELRRAIASRLALEAGYPAVNDPTKEQVEAAEAAIRGWIEGGEEEHDPAAFRSIGPLEQLLSEHRQILERIEDLMDRRLS